MTRLDPGSVEGLPPHVPVLIAGGGPSGLFLALELAHRGIRSLVIEPRNEVDPHRPRAKTTNARTMTHLRRLGLAEELRRRAPLSAEYSEDVIFCSTLLGREVKRFEHAFQLHRERFDLQPEAGQQVPQPIVEEVLREAVAASPLATLATGFAVSALGEREVSVSGSGTGVDGVEPSRRVGADYIVGADGSASVVRKSLGIALQGGSAARSNLNVLFRSTALAGRVELDPAVQYWVMSPEASGIIGRADLGDLWWTIVQGVDVDDPDVDPVALVHAMVGDTDAADQIDVEVIATDPWTARMLLAERYRGGDSFLAGDAAHLNPPWGGHGFNTSIGDAVNLGWKLAARISGWGGDEILDSYEAERRPVAARTIRDATNNGGRLANDFADRMLGEPGAAGDDLRARAALALEVKRSEFLSLGLVLGYSYAGTPLVAADALTPPPEHPIDYVPSAHPGSLLPHAWLADGRSLYDLLEDSGFTLLLDPAAAGAASSFGSMLALADAAGDGDAAGDAGGAGHRIPFRVVVVDGCPPGDLAALWEAPAVLVRPDQHVAWRGPATAEGAAAAAIALRRAAGWPAAPSALQETLADATAPGARVTT